jgi:PAS domain S-box-containing protein
MADITKIDAFIQSSPHPTWLTTAQGHCVYANPALERLTGFNSDQINQADWCTFLVEEDRAVASASWQRSLATGTPYRVQVRMRGNDGPPGWVEVTAFGHKAGDGSELWLFTGLDLNEVATQKRPELEAQIQATLNVIPAHTWYALPSGALTFLNERAANYLGLPKDHPLRFGIDTGAEWDSHTTFLHPDDREEARRVWSICLRTGTAGEFTFRVPSIEGKYRWFLTRAEPLRANDKTLLYWIGVNLDIDDRKRGEEALELMSRDLQESKTRLEEAQSIAHVGYWVFDVGNDELTWSDETYRIFGMRPQERPMNLAAFQEMIHAEDRESLLRATQEVRDGGRPEVELRIVRPSGEVRIIHSPSAVKRDVVGQSRQMFGIVQDITDRKRAEEALQLLSGDLQDSKAKLEEAQRITHVGYWEWDILTGHVNLSDETYRIYGLRQRTDPIDSATVRGLIHPEDQEAVFRVAEDAILRGVRYDSEHRLVRPNGEVRTVHSLGDLKRDSSGRAYQMFGTIQDITDRKRAEDKIREQEAELRQIVDLAPQLVTVFGPHRERLYANRIVLDYLGISLDEWRQRPDSLEFLHPDDRERVRADSDRSLSSGDPYELEFRVRKHTGNYRWFLTRFSPVRDDRGQIMRWYVAATDIEDRKRAEEVLQQSQFYLAEGQRLAHMGSWAFNPSGFFEYWSQELFKIYGLDPQKGPPTLEQYLATIHLQDRGFMAETIKRMQQESAGCDVKKRIVRPDGELRYIRCVGIPVVEGGVLKGFLGTAMDITEQELLTEELERRQAHLTDAQKLTHTGSWAWRLADRETLHLSEEWYRIYGFDPARGATTWEEYFERIHPEDRLNWKSTIESAIAEKADYDQEFRILLPKGIVKWIHTVGHPVFSDAGDLEQFVGSSTDITELKSAEQEREKLRQLEADLAHIDRVSTLGEMAASLAHEIKQPIAAAITSANSCIEWLAHDPPNLDRARAAAARIDKYGNRAAEIIDRIRSFYKKSPPQRELVDVNGIIHEMFTLLKGEADRFTVAMRPDLFTELPKIMADRVQLQQVFMNLMLNAIEAMENSGGELAVKSELQDSQLQFSVSDTGVGLPAEKMDQIFSAFFTTKPQGSGMGLAISRSIVESHGGQLWASANSGGGATFHFTLPIHVTESSPLLA